MDKTTEKAGTGHYCTFRLARRLFGFNILAVKEVNTQATFTPIPHAPPEVCGYVNLRGNIVLALDLRLLLGMEPAARTPESRLIIFKAAVGESFGVLVDAIGEIVTLDAGQTEDCRPELEGATGAPRVSELIGGVGKLQGELVILVQAEKLLRAVAKSM
ncbi:chemotaxis protein CheW [Gemmata sp. G18]|uniref:Chemotaxis protein CheW n=1 Tax=Gemmata palustris TaxID=2822762 RepID=A0ABS5BL34_9BACT|nr:chemotaxis protein CheW [Gemmata palustris]MBP3954407.1 chemotaxis protein CheW [Gemmata palustris]